MIYCYRCGTQISESEAFCHHCGAKQPASSKAQEVFDRVKRINDTPDYSSEIDPRDVKDNKIYAILAYFGLFVLLTIFVAPKKSRYARFHANQGIVLLIFDMLINAVTSAVNTMLNLPRIIDVALNGSEIVNLALPVAVSIVLSLLSIVSLVLTIIGVVNAVNGRCKELPIIGKIRILK